MIYIIDIKRLIEVKSRTQPLAVRSFPDRINNL